jgi:hypothetical protein
MILMIIVNLLFGFIFGPKTGALILLTGAGIGIIFTHVYANISLTLYTRTQKVFRWLRHGVVPIASTIIALVIVGFTVEQDILSQLVHPGLANFAYAASAVVGLIWSFVFALIISYYYVKKKPKIATKAGTFDADGIEIKWD